MNTKGFILLILGIGFVSCLSLGDKPRNPKIQVPVTYNIDWWSHQKDLCVDSFDVKIIDSRLNLFNAESLLSYHISGKIGYNNSWQPQIKMVHISERINTDTTQLFDRIVEITPIVKVKENKKVKNGVENFSFTNECIIHSNHWGRNRIKFICGQREQIIDLQQRK
jgi:hypothetical protein